jgi:DNA-binding HxlR family transcriptional regulator
MSPATPATSPASAAPGGEHEDAAAGVLTTSGEIVCPIGHTLRVLGTTKWTGYVIRELLPGPKRFGEIRAGVGDANPKPLTDTLRMLEDIGLVSRAAYAEMPPRVVYTLTGRGHSLGPVLQAMAEWGANDLRT